MKSFDYEIAMETLILTKRRFLIVFAKVQTLMANISCKSLNENEKLRIYLPSFVLWLASNLVSILSFLPYMNISHVKTNMT